MRDGTLFQVLLILSNNLKHTKTRMDLSLQVQSMDLLRVVTQNEEILEPGKGYWVRTNGSGSIILIGE